MSVTVHPADHAPDHAPELGLDAQSIVASMLHHLTYSLAKTPKTATQRDWYHALTASVKERLVERLIATFARYYQEDAKRVYYLSLEFLIGRSLGNGILNLGIESAVREAMAQLGLDIDSLCWLEDEAALGNGGLGRLAACILDALATLDLPGYGYGIRYEYGMFNQRIDNGWQVESPETWLRYGNPWEIPRPEVLYPVHFNGRVVEFIDSQGRVTREWTDTDQVMAMAYDMPIPGFATGTVNNLRLWSAKSTRDFELQKFNQGDYLQALQNKTDSENLSRVLYPDDSTDMGRRLRLKQEYFFVSATLQDILRRFQTGHEDWRQLPEKAVIQLNDTHPALAIPELMRLLIDIHDLDWDQAWDITRRCFAYTNHTLLPEALETWPVDMIGRILPRHLQIIFDINQHFLTEVRHQFPGDRDRMRRMSLIDEDYGRRVRMAYVAIVGSSKVNGVSALHSALLKSQLFADFNQHAPERFINITNGITPRRWLNQANQGLSELINRTIGKGWQTNLGRLRELEPYADNAQFREDFRAVKRQCKHWLNQIVQWRTQIQLLPEALYDVQVKRIHEYKRQLLNLLHVVVLYNRIRRGEGLAVPRNIIFGGKSAPGYDTAKRTIKLINDVAEVINHDPVTQGLLRMAFFPNYDVGSAASIIPAADLSEQISTAGMEASGTGNMKFALNGALTIGTLDGANIEIREEVGAENFFLFGMTADEVETLRYGYHSRQYYEAHGELREALDQIASGYFSPDQLTRHQTLVNGLLDNDRFFVLADFADYLRCQRDVTLAYQDQEQWTRKAILNVARMGRFSIDRTVQEYASQVWHLEPLRVHG